MSKVSSQERTNLALPFSVQLTNRRYARGPNISEGVQKYLDRGVRAFQGSKYFVTAHSRLLVHIASPTSHPYVGTQLTALFHTQPPLKCQFYGIATQTVNCAFHAVKAQPASQAPGHCHQLGLAYGRETWVYPTNTLSAAVAFLLLPDTNLLPQAGITHYSQLLTRQHSTKFLLVFFIYFFKVNLSLSSKFRPPHEGFRQATS